MGTIIKFADNLPSIYNFPASSIERILLKDYTNPESTTELKEQFYFNTSEFDYVIRIHKPNKDDELFENNPSAFFNALWGETLNKEQKVILENQKIKVSMIRANLKKREGELLTYNYGRLQEEGSIKSSKYDLWSQEFSACYFTWLEKEDINLIDNGNFRVFNLENIFRYINPFRSIENPQSIIQDILSKFKAASIKYNQQNKK